MPLQRLDYSRLTPEPVNLGQRLQSLTAVAQEEEGRRQNLEAGKLNIENARRIASERGALDNLFRSGKSGEDLYSKLSQMGQAGNAIATKLRESEANINADNARQISEALKAAQSRIEMESDAALNVAAA